MPDPLPTLVDLAGPSHAAPLLLLHGWTGSKEDFAPILPQLSTHRRVVAPDLPGHGGTAAAGDAADHAIAPLADWVLDVADHVGLEEFHLLGHSLGGLLAQAVAQQAAHRITCLVLVGSGLGAPGEETLAWVMDVARTARDEGLEAAWKVATRDADQADPRGEQLRERFLNMSVEALVGGARALLSAAPRWAFLHGLDVPALVCHGDGDQTWRPHEQRLLARTINHARYRVIGDALHSPAIENPAGLLEVLQPFLADADPR